ncbi:hypothetical protein A8924_7358 [Saccharopolyspora erythraea NRRL 2338]|uniref:Uncharacterized protein n=2 Tax=Saccharopolyspora erythraea TaxID=1836 RepID=A4FQ34_SACEN|nr:hypothetical protein [Saccharopolyspora erythraea]EQD84374.1 hypothetical protein N599_20390 [Saccharopolyspora erythraea D]PFG99804.1 hypothetical protein A8924_7358 [Saccharopolyspora erythraea NRRL 2338]QRK89674.1 hypothetical protein JQX30_35025 [Saccharopolyspora erythraea]CAM06159.1 hypothetical protein SACE_6997 [Saccharopolyspora erythraea NRRL 2338]
MRVRPPAELRVLRDLFEACDPAPRRLVEAAYAAASRKWSGGGSALRLIGDSADAPARTRRAGMGETRVLTFAMPGRMLEMDLIPVAEGLFRAVGLVLGRPGHSAPAGDVVLRHATGESVGALDERGGFAVDDVPRGPLSVVFRQERSAAAVADWLVC